MAIPRAVLASLMFAPGLLALYNAARSKNTIAVPTSKDTFVVSRPIRLGSAPIARGTPYAERFVLGTLGLALAVAVLSTLLTKKGNATTETLKWDIGSSWASNVGVAGGLVTALVNAAFLPDVPWFMPCSQSKRIRPRMAQPQPPASLLTLSSDAKPPYAFPTSAG